MVFKTWRVVEISLDHRAIILRNSPSSNVLAKNQGKRAVGNGSFASVLLKEQKSASSISLLFLQDQAC